MNKKVKEQYSILADLMSEVGIQDHETIKIILEQSKLIDNTCNRFNIPEFVVPVFFVQHVDTIFNLYKENENDSRLKDIFHAMYFVSKKIVENKKFKELYER